MIREVKIDKDGRFRIPKAMRDELGLEPRQQLEVSVIDGGLKLVPIAKKAKSLKQ